MENMEVLDYIQAEEKQEELKRTGMIRGGTVVSLKSLADVERILRYSIKTREKYGTKNSSQAGSDSKAHLVFNINVKMKDKDSSSSLPVINSVVQFVRFGGTERMSKAAGHPHKGEKYQESIVINSDHANLAKVVYGVYTGQKTINYDESKLIKMLRLSINNKSCITLIGCLNPNEANFEDNLNTLAHLDRCKHFEEASKDKGALKKPKEAEPKAKPTKPAKQNIIQQLQEEMQEKKSKIEFLQADYKKKFDDLAKELGITEDLEKLIYNQNARGRRISAEWKQLRDQRNAFQKWEGMELYEKQLDDEIKELKLQEEKLRAELKEKEAIYM